MTSSIKPPGGSGTGPSGVDALRESADLDPSSGADRAQGAPTEAAGETPAAPLHGSASWLSRYEAGEVSREAAIDGIVSEALATHDTGALSGAQRVELEGVLREALATDPNLVALFGEG